MFKTKQMKWLVITLTGILLIAALLLASCRGATTAPAGEDLSAKLAQANADLSKTQSDLSKAQTRIAELEKGAPVQPQFVWKSASVYAKDHAFSYGLELMMDMIENLSKGRIKIERYYSGALGQHQEILDGVKAGTITMGWTYPYTTVSKKFVVAGGPALPVSWSALEELNQMYYNGINYRIMKQGWEESGYHLIFTSHGVPHVLFSNKAVRTPADVKGMKIRVWDAVLIVEALKRAGAAPTVMAMGDVYSALKTNVLDGITHVPSTGAERSWWEVTKYVSTVGWWADFFSLAMNKKAYDDLPADLKTIVDKASRDASMMHGTYALIKDQEAIQTLVSKGMTYVELTPAEQKAFADTIQPESLWETVMKPALGDALFNEWKSEVQRLRTKYG